MHLQHQFRSSGRGAGNRSRGCFLLAKCSLLLLLLCYHTGKDPSSLSSSLQPGGAFREQTKYINNSKTWNWAVKAHTHISDFHFAPADVHTNGRCCLSQYFPQVSSLFAKYLQMYSNCKQGFGCHTEACSTVPPLWVLKTISCHVRPKALSFTTAARVDKTKNSFLFHLRIISALTLAVKDQRAFEACSYFSLPLRNSWGLWKPGMSCNGRFSDPLFAQNRSLDHTTKVSVLLRVS